MMRRRQRPRHGSVGTAVQKRSISESYGWPSIVACAHNRHRASGLAYVSSHKCLAHAGVRVRTACSSSSEWTGWGMAATNRVGHAIATH